MGCKKGFKQWSVGVIDEAEAETNPRGWYSIRRVTQRISSQWTTSEIDTQMTTMRCIYLPWFRMASTQKLSKELEICSWVLCWLPVQINIEFALGSQCA